MCREVAAVAVEDVAAEDVAASTARKEVRTVVAVAVVVSKVMRNTEVAAAVVEVAVAVVGA